MNAHHPNERSSAVHGPGFTPPVLATEGSGGAVDPGVRLPAAHAAGVQIEDFSDARAPAWAQFVQSSQCATVFHELGWMRAVRETYGHRPRYLVAVQGADEIRGILPLFEVQGPFTGRALISVPYGVYGGVAADSAAVGGALLTHARTVARDTDAAYLEVRQGVPLQGFEDRCQHFSFRRALPESVDQVLTSFPRKARTAIRAARDRHGLRFEVGAHQLDTFYRLYVMALRRLGSPPHRKRFFVRLLQEFGDRCAVAVAWYGEVAVAGTFNLLFKNQIIPYFFGNDPHYTEMNVSNFLYYNVMMYGIERGAQVFDFGRTRQDNTGGCQFKINQGFEPEPLHYSFHSPREIDAPDLRPSNARFSLARAVWKRLPLPLVRGIGGWASRWLP